MKNQKILVSDKDRAEILHALKWSCVRRKLGWILPKLPKKSGQW